MNGWSRKVKVQLFEPPWTIAPPGSHVHGLLQARVPEWVVFPFSRGSSQPRDGTWVSSTAGNLFTIWATREVPRLGLKWNNIFCEQEDNLCMSYIKGKWVQIIYFYYIPIFHHIKNFRRIPYGLSEKAMAMAPHSSTLAWKMPWTKKPGRLQSMRLLRVRHDWVTSHSLSLSCIGEGNGTPLQCSCLENPRDGGAWWAAVYGVAQSRTGLSSVWTILFLRFIEGRTFWSIYRTYYIVLAV